MVHIATTDIPDRDWNVSTFQSQIVPDRYSILLVRDHDRDSDHLESVCEFLNIDVEHATSVDDLASMLPNIRPLAVIADLDGQEQDGFHVMKMAAAYDRSLPILLLTSNDPAILGAIDAVREVWALKSVTTTPNASEIGPLVDFICQSARDAGRSTLMRI
jgi:DNA-binding NtrC family response regulator